MHFGAAMLRSLIRAQMAKSRSVFDVILEGGCGSPKITPFITGLFILGVSEYLNVCVLSFTLFLF